jgi:hypothetical protein
MISFWANASDDDEVPDWARKHSEEEARKGNWDKVYFTPEDPELAEQYFAYCAEKRRAWAKEDAQKDTWGDIEAEILRERFKLEPFRWKDPSTFPRRQFLHGRHWIRKYLSATIAGGGVGKTTLTIVDILEMVTGQALISDYRGPKLRGLIWNGEDPLEELQRRVLAAMKHYGLTDADIGGRLFLKSGRDMPITLAREERGGLVIAEPVVAALIAELAEKEIDVMSVDPFVRCHHVNENDNNKVNAVCEQWAKVADRRNMAIDLAHHTKKLGGVEADEEAARGASAMGAAIRHSRVLNRMTEAEARDAKVEDNHKLYFRINDGKVNMSPPAETSEWIKIEDVSLDNDPAPIDPKPDQVGVATRWEWPDLFDGISLQQIREFQNRPGEKQYQLGQKSPRWAGYLLAEMCGFDADDAPLKKRLWRMINQCAPMAHSST